MNMKHYIYTGTKEDMIYLEKELNKYKKGVFSLKGCTSGACIIYINDDSFSVLDNQEMNVIHSRIENEDLYIIGSIEEAITMIKE